MAELLKIENLKTHFRTDDGLVKAVDDVSFSISIKETLGLVGESGCGKSVTSLSILRLVQTPPGKIVGGRILFKGTDLLSLSEKEMRSIRGKEISMIFQEPMTSLNPVFTIGDQISETIMLHEGANKKLAKEKAIDMLNAVSIPSPEKRFSEYPHQMSGGMRQRVMIAMAIACKPALLIADEPTTALDVTIQAQILELLAELKEKYDLSMLLITHSLGIVAEVADRVAVMYAGKIIEMANVQSIFNHPLHPYTIGLLRSLPRLDDAPIDGVCRKLETIEGAVPNLTSLPEGCYFSPRCHSRRDECSLSENMILKEVTPGHFVMCTLNHE